MAKWTGRVALAAAMVTGVLVVAGGAAPVQAVAAQPYQVLVRPADAQNPLNTNHQFTVAVRTDADGDESVDDPVIGATLDLGWTGPPGSIITAVNGTPVTPNAFGATTCVTIQSPTAPALEGICTVDVMTPLDVGTGTLRAAYAIPGASAGVPDLPLPPNDQGTTCAAGTYVPGPIIQSCTDWVDVVRIQTTGDHTWVGYIGDVDPDAVLPVRVPHTFAMLIDRTTGATSVPANNIIANFSWLTPPTGSTVTTVNGQPAPGARACTTTGAGSCSITVVSPTPGPGTLRLDSLIGALIGGQPKTESPTPSSDRTAVARWVDWRVAITPPTATNYVDDQHVFTLTLETNDGNGWVPEGAGRSIVTTWGGPTGSEIIGVSAGMVASPTAATCQTNANGQCTVTVDSPTTGAGTLVATDVIVSLPGYTPPGGAAGAPFNFDVVDAEGDKLWIEFFATVGPSATNLAGDPHTFTIAATYDDGSGLKSVPNGSTVGYSWTGGGTANPPSSCTITAGTCDVVVSSAVANIGTLTITSVTAMINGSPFTDAAQAAANGGSLSATKTWVELLATVGPTATNLVGDPHVFTIVATYDDGTQIRPVPNGSTVRYTWTGTGTANPPSSCTTVLGMCKVTVTSADTGTGTITVVSITATIGGSTFDQVAPAAADNGSLVATKTWVDYRISITPPTDENLVDNDHLFTVLVERDAGNGFVPFQGAKPTITQTGVGSIAAETCSDGTLANGTCEVIGISEEPGDMDVTATLVVKEAGPSTLTISDKADKLWVDYRLTLTPKEAINKVTEAHVFVAKLEVDRGDGFKVAKNETLQIGATGVGAIINIDAAGPGSNTCITDTVGTCRITVNSAEPGTLFLTAQYEATVGDTTGTFAAAATKGWIIIDLPETGSESGQLLRLALGSALAGLALLLLARRRRSMTLA